ncbi:hypothetical protein PR048_031081 [Dryococelus australis]|uniref:Uncharacterized protein n=1 Tax=Dryococelus australis TaxID=614101 RepID=A0ABQ9G758_9NEOP|nr:hypothetical protein PR048_031081 [Dryococelus australis]
MPPTATEAWWREQAPSQQVNPGREREPNVGAILFWHNGAQKGGRQCLVFNDTDVTGKDSCSSLSLWHQERGEGTEQTGVTRRDAAHSVYTLASVPWLVLERAAGLEIEMKFISNRRNWRFEISIRDQQPSSTNVRLDYGSELGSFDLGSGKMLVQLGIRQLRYFRLFPTSEAWKRGSDKGDCSRRAENRIASINFPWFVRLHQNRRPCEQANTQNARSWSQDGLARQDMSKPLETNISHENSRLHSYSGSDVTLPVFALLVVEFRQSSPPRLSTLPLIDPECDIATPTPMSPVRKQRGGEVLVEYPPAGVLEDGQVVAGLPHPLPNHSLAEPRRQYKSSSLSRLITVLSPSMACRLLALSQSLMLRGLCSCASKVKKRGSDTGDTNTHAWRLIAPTRKSCSVSVTKDDVERSRWLRTTNLRVPTLNFSPANTSSKNGVVRISEAPTKTGNISQCAGVHSRLDSPVQLKLMSIVQQTLSPEDNSCDICLISGGIESRLLASHLGDPDSIPGGGGGVRFQRFRDDVAGRRVFSVISRFSHICIPALLYIHLASPSSALKISVFVLAAVLCSPSASEDLVPGGGTGPETLSGEAAPQKAYDTRQLPSTTTTTTAGAALEAGAVTGGGAGAAGGVTGGGVEAAGAGADGVGADGVGADGAAGDSVHKLMRSSKGDVGVEPALCVVIPAVVLGLMTVRVAVETPPTSARSFNAIGRERVGEARSYDGDQQQDLKRSYSLVTCPLSADS